MEGRWRAASSTAPPTTTAPAAYVAAAGLVALVSALAAWVPACRAASIDPAQSLRTD